MIEEQTSALSYEHNGRFDYEICLKPSYLYGSSSDQLTAGYRYPAALVDSIDFTFTYDALDEDVTEIWINAVLYGGDIWEKEIELASGTAVDGMYNEQFSLDLDEIHEIYNTVEQETGINIITRSVNIEVHIKNAENDFIYNLPVSINDTILEIDSNLSSAFSTGNAGFSYVVNLKPNTIYDTPSLASPSSSEIPVITLNPGGTIFTNLVDKMMLDYSYRFEADDTLEQLTANLEMIVTLEATDVWIKEFPLLYEEISGNHSTSTVVELDEYLQYLQAIHAETGASADSYEIAITATVRISAATPAGNINETFRQSLEGVINNSVLTWESPLAASRAGDILVAETVPSSKLILGFPVNAARVLFPIVMAVSFIFLSILAVSHYLSRGAVLSGTEQEILHIRKKYGDRIIEATNQKPAIGERIISLNSIDSLVNTADELGKLVIYKPPTRKNKYHVYYVFDGSTRYQHILGGYRDIKEDDYIKIDLSD